MVTATLSFYEKNENGSFDTHPSVYKATGNTKEEILNNKELFWQAIEIEGFDDSEVLVTMEFEKDGKYLDRDEGIITAKIVRTDEPSNYIVWDNKVPMIFKIDRSCSSFEITAK